MMKRFLILLTLLAVVTACCVMPASAEESWTAIVEDSYSISEDGVISVVTPGRHPVGDIGPEVKGGPINCYLYNGFRAEGAYTVSVTMTGTMDLPNSGHAKEGIIPWYVDDDNYLVVYAEWADYDRPTDMRCVQVTGRINGADINVFDSAAFDYLPGNGWHDFWCDGLQIPHSDSYILTVDVVPNEDYTSIVFLFGTEEDPAIKSGEVWVQNSDNLAVPGRVGVYSMGEPTTFTNFTVEPIVIEEEPDDPKPTDPEPTDPKPGESKPAGTEDPAAPGAQEPDKLSDGLIIGAVAAVVVIAAAAAVVFLVLKKKK